MPFDLVNSSYIQNGRYSLDITDYSLLLDSASPHTDNRTFRCLARGTANPASLTTTTAGLTVGITQATLTTKGILLEYINPWHARGSSYVLYKANG